MRSEIRDGGLKSPAGKGQRTDTDYKPHVGFSNGCYGLGFSYTGLPAFFFILVKV